MQIDTVLGPVESSDTVLAATAQNMKKMALLAHLYRLYIWLTAVPEVRWGSANEKKGHMKKVWENIKIATFGCSQNTNTTIVWS